MSLLLVPINELLFRNKNSFYNMLFTNRFPSLFGCINYDSSSILDWEKRNAMWEKIKKNNLEYINLKTKEWIENSKQNKIREIVKNVFQKIENSDLTKENLSKASHYPYYFKPYCNENASCKQCLCRKQIKCCNCHSEKDISSTVEIEEILVKSKSNPTTSEDYKSKLVSSLFKNNENNNNNNYTIFGIAFCGVGIGLGTYYFYRKSK